MNKGLEIVIISDDNKDLFRVHFYENCIKFDSKFAEGISKNELVSRNVMELNKQWAERKIKVEDVLEKIVVLVELNSDKFKDYYFKDSELNKDGKYVDLVPLDCLLITFDKKAHDFFKYLLVNNVLIEIDKDKFEKDLKEDAYKEIYVESYTNIFKNKKIKFYQYKLNEVFGEKTCNIITSNKEVLFGYTF